MRIQGESKPMPPGAIGAKISGAFESLTCGQPSGKADALHPPLSRCFGTLDQGLHAADDSPVARSDALDLTARSPRRRSAEG